MEFALSGEQEEFRQIIRRFVLERSPMPAVRQAAATEPGYDRDLWSGMAEELGLVGLVIPQDYGGAGATMIEAAIAMAELGRGVVPSPLFATVALGVVPMLMMADEQQKKDLLPQMAAGTITAAAALEEPGAGGSGSAVAMRAVSQGDTVLLTGTKMQVIDGHSADIVLVLALPPGDSTEPQLYLVDGDAAGLGRSRVATLDVTRPMATLEFDAVSAVPLAGDVAATSMQRVLAVAKTLLAAEMVGGIDGAMCMSVEYAKIRHQFNRPIGSFQAIKHRCAEMAIELDSARAVALYAAHLAAVGDSGLVKAASMAVATAAAGFDFTASWNLQIHGGIGFTWEHDAHLYYRRAKADRVLLGSVRDHWLDVADQVGI
ncbi:acyl-CoA dehydrogenase family protein [Mycobacterium sp. 29Ha]|uniref:acyl-CoA dehydrogenase family protein n=1 Tax=Mycobacterium sp. 29Ha TaxID=2939268 RepID=UPI002939292A|nr:acyl-CoA dehydrogenase family protein [Mycobacterium sp. 29Ha]MDV3133422.1 acyl-CoA/acyl-ACP dehydrogenase [Mycobacterium sp. 29Ha]